MSVTDLPALNACLNATSALLLLSGYRQIRRKNTNAHQLCMIFATVVSAAFLVSYLVYHYQVGSVSFKGQGWIRPIYFFILLTHIMLAMATIPLVAITMTRALKSDFVRHARVARWTLPIWLYVSVTGVVIYGMLYL